MLVLVPRRGGHCVAEAGVGIRWVQRHEGGHRSCGQDGADRDPEPGAAEDRPSFCGCRGRRGDGGRARAHRRRQRRRGSRRRGVGQRQRRVDRGRRRRLGVRASGPGGRGRRGCARGVARRGAIGTAGVSAAAALRAGAGGLAPESGRTRSSSAMRLRASAISCGLPGYSRTKFRYSSSARCVCPARRCAWAALNSNTRPTRASRRGAPADPRNG